MKANARTPAEIFGNSVRYVVPLFQRPYVWTLDTQWEPLWEDVRTLTERVLTAPPVAFGPAQVSPHFLGAVVVDQQATPAGFIDVRHVIDGQQRLTTLQLLLDAVQDVVAELGEPADAAGLHSLVLNNPALAAKKEEVFKVWPTDRDQEAFAAAMDDATTPSPAQAATPILRAHEYFTQVARSWAEEDGPDQTASRLRALTQALAQHLKLVVIDLEPGDNAQVIFETLNHRGSPLLAADLVKNLVFQLAQQQNLDVVSLYRTYWREFDEDYWRVPQSQGRRLIPRIDLFLHHWLTMRLQREVPTDRVFTEFRDEVIRREPDIASLLRELAHDARVYASFDQFPAASVPGRFHYRVIRALDSAVISPYLLWVLRHPGEELPVTQRDKALRAVESWLVRRALTRATSKDLNNAVLGLLKAVREAPVEQIGDTTVTFLEQQRADSRAWPDDDVVTRTLLREPIYKSLTRPRMRMVLEALEDSLRGPLGEGQPCPRNLTIEHVMPQAWHEHWASDLDGDDLTVETRDARVQLLGNLTLVNGRLNPTLSNRPWRDDQAQARGLGPKGKRTYLLDHAELKLSARIAAYHGDAWTDEDIETRTAEMVYRILTIWPGPAEGRPVTASHLPDVDDRVAAASVPHGTRTSNPAGSYRVLGTWLNDQGIDVVSLSFEQVEQILDAPLPASARTYPQHWRGYEGSALARAVADAGWKVAAVDLTEERVVLARVDGRAEKEPSGGLAAPDTAVGRRPTPRGVTPMRGADAVLRMVTLGHFSVGTTLRGRYQGQRYDAIVLEDGRLASGRRIYSTPSEAARGVTGQASVDGWKFWSLPDGRPLKDLPGREQ